MMSTSDAGRGLKMEVFSLVSKWLPGEDNREESTAVCFWQLLLFFHFYSSGWFFWPACPAPALTGLTSLRLHELTYVSKIRKFGNCTVHCWHRCGRLLPLLLLRFGSDPRDGLQEGLLVSSFQVHGFICTQRSVILWLTHSCNTTLSSSLGCWEKKQCLV